MSPKKPANIDPLAERILRKLSGIPEASEIVLGGYLALGHYADYRDTHDIDAWWRGRASPATESAIHSAMQEVATDEGFELRVRRFGETVSFELFRGGRKQFSFQIALRSVTLEPPLLSDWPPIVIDTLADTVGAKMNALVERGAARDFLDIEAVVTAGLVSAQDCWELWARKNARQSIDAAKCKTLRHLGSLEARRPLDSIADPVARERARKTRDWFRLQFLKK